VERLEHLEREAMTASPAGMPVAASRMLALWIVAAAAAAMGLSLVYLPLAVCAIVCALILVYAWVSLRLYALQAHAAAIVALRCDTGTLGYQLCAGTWINGSVLTGGLVNRWLTVVRVQDISERAQKRTIVLLPDQLSADNYRRLRVYLRWFRVE
jgi:toxin CptA